MGFFAVRYRPGPAWEEGKSIFEQQLDDHVAYLGEAYRRRQLVAGGPLSDSAGGLSIFQVDDEAEALELVERDPAVVRGVIRPEVHPWAPIAWDHTRTPADVLYEVPPLGTARTSEPRRDTG